MFTDTSKPSYRRSAGYLIAALICLGWVHSLYVYKYHSYLFASGLATFGFAVLTLVTGWGVFKEQHQRELGRKYLPLRRRVAIQSCCMSMFVCGMLLAIGMVGLLFGKKEIVQAVGGFFVLATMIPFIVIVKEVYLGKTSKIKWIEY